MASDTIPALEYLKKKPVDSGQDKNVRSDIPQKQTATAMEKINAGTGVEPGAKGAFSRNAPTKDVTWHHHPEREGVLRLIPRSQHKASGPI